MGDGLLSIGQGRSLNKDWDGIWRPWTHIGDFGWSTEIRIPFHTLNFDPKISTWGINFQRTVRRKTRKFCGLDIRETKVYIDLKTQVDSQD